MKKMFFFVLLIMGAIAADAQIRKADSGSIKKPVQNKIAAPAKVMKNTAGTPVTAAPASSNTQQKNSGTPGQQNQSADNSPYFITGAKVIIKTGSDAKEYPSRVRVYLFPMPAATYTYTYTLGQLNLTNAMNVNSSTEFGLMPLNQQKIPWPVYYSPGYSGTNKPSNPFTSGAHSWMLDDLQRQGFRLVIAYHPNIALDAWEIKQVTVKLEIKKADGTPHPALNNKTIVFNITSPMLGVPTGLALVCEADQSLSPATHYLTKDILTD